MAAKALQIKEAQDAIDRALLHNENINFLISLWNKYSNSEPDVINHFYRYVIANMKELSEQNVFGKLNHRQYHAILSAARLCNDVAVDDVREATMQWLNGDEDNIRHFDPKIYSSEKWIEVSPELLSSYNEVHENHVKSKKGSTKQLVKSWSTTALNSSSSVNTDEPTQESFRSVINSNRTTSSCFHTQSDLSLQNIYRNEDDSNSIQAEYAKSADVLECFSSLDDAWQQRDVRFLKKSGTKPNVCFNLSNRKDPHKRALPLYQASSINSRIPRYLSPSEQQQKFYRHNTNPAIAVFGVDFVGKTVLRVYVLQWKVWSHPIELNIPFRRHFATAFHDRRIFIIGGNDASSVGSRNTFVFQVQNRMMYPYNNLHQERLAASVAVMDDGKMYVVGGRDNNYKHHLRNAEMISINSPCSCWEQLEPMNQGRENPGLVVANNRLYVIGGFTNSCEYLNLQDNKWIRMKSLPERFRFSGMHAVLHHQTIYAFRRNDPADICMLNVKRNVMHFPTSSGDVPAIVMGCGLICGEIWAMDQNGELFSFIPERSHWKKNHIRTPANSFHLILDAQVVNQTELEGLCTFPRE